MDWQAILARTDPLLLTETPLTGAGRVLALAPHPDDPEAIAVTLRLFAQGGADLHWAVVTSGWSGVDDDFVGPDRTAKGNARADEQRAAARLFGLPEARLALLRLDENDAGELADTPENRRRFTAHLDALAPDLALLPHREDTNATHRRVFAWFAEWAAAQGRPLAALCNEDPKTVRFTPHLTVTFGDATAAWKAELLECHRSQSARNMRVRGITFAERILALNRAAHPGGYAERFIIERWG